MYTEICGGEEHCPRPRFLSGYALQQGLPGPTFHLLPFTGAITMGNKGYGIVRARAVQRRPVAVIGVICRAAILILFIVPF